MKDRICIYCFFVYIYHCQQYVFSFAILYRLSGHFDWPSDDGPLSKTAADTTPDTDGRCWPPLLTRTCSTRFSARCNNTCTSHAYAMMPVRLSVTEVHRRIIANLGFKFRSHFTVHWPPSCCGRRAAGGRHAACGRIISRHASQC